MKFKNLQDALDFIQGSNSPTDLKIELMDLISRHVQEGSEIKFAVHQDEIQSVLFQSEHDVLVTVELESVIIHAHSLSGISSISTQTKEKIMTIENNTQAAAAQLNEMEAIIAASMKKILESSLDPILEAALNKQQERIEATVKKTVDESLKATVDEAVKKALDEALKNTPKDAETKKVEEPKKETKEAAKASTDGISLGKAAAYLAGAAAIATGGYFAWQKWGGASSAPAAE